MFYIQPYNRMLVLTALMLTNFTAESIIHQRHATAPQGLHLAVGDDPISEVVAMWCTKARAPSTVTLKDSSGRTIREYWGQLHELPDITMSGRRYLHRVIMKNLTAGKQYYYIVGDEKNENSSAMAKFTMWTKPAKNGPSAEVLFYGHFRSNRAHRWLQTEVLSGRYSAMLSLGNLGCGHTHSQFLTNLQDLAAWTPYMTSPGRTELINGFTDYKYLFSMPHSKWPMERYWYSFNLHRAHIISFSTEVFFSKEDYPALQQYAWLERDLKEANKPVNRGQWPWIIAFGHRPLYCSGAIHCKANSRRIRQGLEELFFKYGVDLVIQAQEGFYERSWPVYKGDYYANDYIHPHAPVYVSSAAFTCDEGPTSPGTQTRVDTSGGAGWCARKINMIGTPSYGRLKIVNHTHLHFEEVSATNHSVLDRLWLQQRHHGAFGMRSRYSSSLIIIASAAAGILVLVVTVIILRKHIKKCITRRGDEQTNSYVNLNDKVFEL